MIFLLFVAIALVVLWLLGLVFFKAIGFLIHVVLVLALILLIIWLLRAILHVF